MRSHSNDVYSRGGAQFKLERPASVGEGRPIWRNARVFALRVPHLAAAEGTLPWPLRLDGTRSAKLFAAEFKDTSFGIAYREVGLLLPALLYGRKVEYCAWMVVDDDAAMIQGRELFGFPKRMAEISLLASEDTGCALRVTRNGVTLLEADWTFGLAQTADARLFERPLITLRGSPGLPGALLYLPSRERVHKAWSATARIKINRKSEDPLSFWVSESVEMANALLLVIACPPNHKLGWLLRVVPVGIVSPFSFLRLWPERSF